MTVKLAQLYAVRAQIDAMILAEETELAGDARTSCPHPEEKRRDASTIGSPRKFLCLQCGQEVLGVA